MEEYFLTIFVIICHWNFKKVRIFCIIPKGFGIVKNIYISHFQRIWWFVDAESIEKKQPTPSSGTILITTPSPVSKIVPTPVSESQVNTLHLQFLTQRLDQIFLPTPTPSERWQDTWYLVDAGTYSNAGIRYLFLPNF